MQLLVAWGSLVKVYDFKNVNAFVSQILRLSIYLYLITVVGSLIIDWVLLVCQQIKVVHYFIKPTGTLYSVIIHPFFTTYILLRVYSLLDLEFSVSMSSLPCIINIIIL